MKILKSSRAGCLLRRAIAPCVWLLAVSGAAFADPPAEMRGQVAAALNVPRDWREGAVLTRAQVFERADCGMVVVANRLNPISVAEFQSTERDIESTPRDALRFERLFSFAFLRSFVVVACPDRRWLLVQGNMPYDHDRTLGTQSSTFTVLMTGDRGNWDIRPSNEDVDLVFSGRRDGTVETFLIVRATAADDNARWWSGLQQEGRTVEMFEGLDLKVAAELTPQSEEER